MSISRKALAAAAALGLATACGTVAVLGGGVASAATPPCGRHCLDIFSKQFGTSQQPLFVLSAASRPAAVGDPVILYWRSNDNPAEDFVATRQGTVSEFNQAGLASSAVNLHYGSDYAFEYEYAPYGVRSGLCIGVAATAAAGSAVSLQPCSVSPRTLWIVDSYDGQYYSSWYGGSYGDHPLINGSDTNFSRPFVLTYPAGASPASHPRTQLSTANITGSTSSSYGTPGPVDVSSGQLWSWDFGPLP
jgi:hypothetical protein